MADPNLAQLLESGLRDLRLDVPAAQQQALLAYVALLNEWNRHYNLTAIRDPAAMLQQHVLDALVALPYLPAGRLLDVGSGAGVPGIPLAVARPDLACVLLDSNGKKTRFIKQVVIALRLANVDVVQSRVEALEAPAPFARIVSRAFSSLEEFVRLSRHLLASDGEWLAWKGRLDGAELRAVRPVAEVLECIAVQVPGVSAERHLIRMRALPA